MSGVGISPPDTTTALGRTRNMIGDNIATSVALGSGTYPYFSDVELSTFLSQGQNNPLMAAGFALMQLAAGAALQAATVQSADLKVDTTKRADSLRALAEEYFAQANAGENFILNDTGFQTVDIRDYLYPTGKTTFSDLFYTTTADEVFADDDALIEDPANPGFYLTVEDLHPDPANPGFYLP